MDGRYAHPNPEYLLLDGVSIHPEANRIQIGNVFLKILHSRALFRFGTSQTGITFCLLHAMLVVVPHSIIGCPILEMDSYEVIPF